MNLLRIQYYKEAGKWKKSSKSFWWCLKREVWVSWIHFKHKIVVLQAERKQK